MTNYYKVLGLDESATESEIKKAYKKLAIKYHPDKGGDPEKFNKIAEAYQVLSCSEKKGEYDNFGKFTFTKINNSFMSPDDLFAQFFGNMEINSEINSFRASNIDRIFSKLVNINEKTNFHNLNNICNYNKNFSSSSSVIIQGNKKIEKIVENNNGIITEKVIETDLNSPKTLW